MIPSTARPQAANQLDHNPLSGGPVVEEPPAPKARDSEYAAHISNSYTKLRIGGQCPSGAAYHLHSPRYKKIAAIRGEPYKD